MRSGLAQRTMLLLLAAVSGSIIVLATAFSLQREDDFAEFADTRARNIAAQVHLTRLMLLSVPQVQRPAVSEGLQSSGTVYAYPASKVAPPQRTAHVTPPDMQDVSKAIGRYAMQPAEVRHTLESGPAYWVSQQIDGEKWWIVVLAGMPPPAPGGVPWLAVGGVLLALLGAAVWYAATITRPLRGIANAVHRIGENLPEPIAVDGPAELRELAGGFNAMLLRLRQIEDERRVLLGGLPHDLRAPLTRLRLKLEMLTDLGEHPAITRDIHSIDRIALQFTEYLRGVQPGDPSTPLENVVRAVVESYRSSGRDVRIRGPAIAQASVPHHSVQRVLENLIENAVQHGQEPIRVEAIRTDPGIVELTVTDQGDGIAPDDLETAVEPFTKLDPARGRGSCGLGLAIVRQLVRQLGGSVRFAQQAEGFSVTARIVTR